MAGRRQSVLPGPRRLSVIPNVTQGLPTGGHIPSSSQGPRPIKQENTYKIEPDDQLLSYKVKEFLKEMMEEELKGKHYDEVECNLLCQMLSDKIKTRLKAMYKSRYKIVVSMSMGPTKPTTANMVSRCVWNDQFDNFAEYLFKNKDLFASALVYLLYYE